ncbi:MAG: hypothetical protein PHW98_06085 [Candidatus Omnitrophica bacterium]|nr:hypothetical protein [Candidatus Omnitrophota bacterium]MDD5771153.1 hypothetical protein [Candidatus Omnitrophota bacterium]
MKLAKPFFLSTALCVLAVCLAGCTTFSGNSDIKSANPGMLEPQSLLKFSDVPVPVGFKNVPTQSYVFESSGVRVGVLKYQGKNTPDQVVYFYKEQMAMYNWSLVNIVEYGQRLLNFERENESCIINIEPRGSTIIITISLGPKSQVGAKKSRTPVK